MTDFQWYDFWRVLNILWTVWLMFMIFAKAHEDWDQFTKKTQDYTIAIWLFCLLSAAQAMEAMMRDMPWRLSTLLLSLVLLWLTRAVLSEQGFTSD